MTRGPRIKCRFCLAPSRVSPCPDCVAAKETMQPQEPSMAPRAEMRRKAWEK